MTLICQKEMVLGNQNKFEIICMFQFSGINLSGLITFFLSHFSGRWSTWDPFGDLGVGLRNSTVGIVGLGRIGKTTANHFLSCPQYIASFPISNGEHTF